MRLLDNKLPSEINVYQKAENVIESCTNMVQLKGARNYINLYFRVYSSPVVRKVNNRAKKARMKLNKDNWIYESSTLVHELYQRLLNKLKVKEKNLNLDY